MLEKDIEGRFRIAVSSIGGMALKLVSPGMSGVPDRLVLLPGGRIVFAEFKRPGGKMRALQLKRKKQLEELGFTVVCIDTPEAMRRFMDEVRTS